MVIDMQQRLYIVRYATAYTIPTRCIIIELTRDTIRYSEDLTVGQKSSAKICVCRKSENALGTKSTHFSIFYVPHVHVPRALGTHLRCIMRCINSNLFRTSLFTVEYPHTTHPNLLTNYVTGASKLV